jgi:hypothetical protein
MLCATKYVWLCSRYDILSGGQAGGTQWCHAIYKVIDLPCALCSAAAAGPSFLVISRLAACIHQSVIISFLGTNTPYNST